MVAGGLNRQNSTSISPGHMSMADFNRLSRFIHETCGIKLSGEKKVMIETRLVKRLKELNLHDYHDYCNCVLDGSSENEELTHMIDVITTNKTDFFREPAHFQFLTGKALPELLQNGAGVNRPFRVWSAGCSTGEEPYTIAMVLSEYALTKRNFRFEIMATDISMRVLQAAKRAIYEKESVAPVPDAMKRKYLLKSRDNSQGLVRIAPEIRELVKFRHLNFMDTDFGITQPFDIIFCRNVIIYFDRPTQERLLMKFCNHLSPGGYVLMGHSETLNGMKLPLVSVAPTTYRKQT
jgi:chemotaxis protein methyltransferase CheR